MEKDDVVISRVCGGKKTLRYTDFERVCRERRHREIWSTDFKWAYRGPVVAYRLQVGLSGADVYFEGYQKLSTMQRHWNRQNKLFYDTLVATSVSFIQAILVWGIISKLYTVGSLLKRSATIFTVAMTLN